MIKYLILLFLPLTLAAQTQRVNVSGVRSDSLNPKTVFVTDTISFADSVRWDDLVAGPLLARLPSSDPATFNEDSITVDFAASGTDIALFQFQLSHATVQDTAYDLNCTSTGARPTRAAWHGLRSTRSRTSAAGRRRL